MLTFRTSTDALIHIPMLMAPLSKMRNVFHIGIDYSHFYNLYLSRFTNSVNVIQMTQKSTEEFVNSLRTFNIEPIFVFVGISYHQVDCTHSNLEFEIKDTLKNLHVNIIGSASSTTAQLSTLLKLKCVNAVMTSPLIILRDVPRWIHYIDFKAEKIVLLRGSIETMKGIISTRSVYEIAAPSFSFDKTMWSPSWPLFNQKTSKVPDIVLSLISSGFISPPRIAAYSPNSPRKPLFPIPQNCLNHLNSLCGIYLSLFQHISQLPFSRLLSLPESPTCDEFLPLLLVQNGITEPSQLNETLISQILAQQNISSTRFSTLFECLCAVSPPKKASSPNETTPEYIISESIRRFLIAHEYIAPGGGLSPWGRAVLVANTGIDMSSILFIELIRADIMDSDFNSSFSSVSITDLIERIFSLFPSETEISSHLIESHIEYFAPTTHIISSMILLLINLIICDTYISIANEPNFDELLNILSQNPLKKINEYSTGVLMRFLLESSNEKRKEFIQSCSRKKLKKDVENAVNWWKSLNRATVELKQRSLKPNSRVSNLKTFLVLFECANHFVEKTIDDVLRLL